MLLLGRFHEPNHTVIRRPMQNQTTATAHTANTVDPEEIERFTRMADEWWDEGGKFRPLHRINPLRIGYIRDHAVRHFDKDITSMQPLAGLSLLDVGCGGGLLCEPMTRLGAEVTGIDAGEKNVKVAELHAEQSGLAIDYRHITAEVMVEEGRQYDVVLALEIVEHVANVPAFMASLLKLVKPGGLLFMSTLNRTAKSFAFAIVGAEYVLRWLPRGTHNWKKFIKPHELHAELRKGGLTVHDQCGMVFNPFSDTWNLSERDLEVNYLLVAG